MMWKWSIYLGFFFVNFQAWAKIEGCTSNGQIKFPVLRYHSASGKKSALLVAVGHLGEKEYYGRTAKVFDTFVKTKSHSTAFLKEFLTCHDSVFVANPSAIPSPEVIVQLLNDDGVHMDLARLKAAVGKDALIKQPCEADNRAVKRPIYQNLSTNELCDGAHQHGIGCQRDDLSYSSGPKIDSVEADLTVDLLPAGTQYLISLLYDKKFMGSLGADKTSHLEDDLMDTINKQRSRKLGDSIAENLKNHDQVVVAWGSQHDEFIRGRLADLGMMTNEIEFIDFANASSPMAKTSQYKYLMKVLPSCDALPSQDLGHEGSSIFTNK